MLIASDGQTGIATAESAHPSLIILDMLMPGLDGVEVLRRLKRTASTSNIPGKRCHKSACTAVGSTRTAGKT